MAYPPGDATRAAPGVSGNGPQEDRRAGEHDLPNSEPQNKTQARIPALRGGKLPSTYMAAKRALAECERVDQCKEWADKHAALASYAKQSKDDELFDLATRIKARATRRMGELLKEIEPAKNQYDANARGGTSPSSRRAVADAAGLSDDQRKNAIRVANVPEDEFEQLVEGDSPPTVTALAEIGTKHKPKPRRSSAEVAQNDARLKYEALWGTLGGLAAAFDATAPELFASGVCRFDPDHIDELKETVRAIHKWLDAFMAAVSRRATP